MPEIRSEEVVTLKCPETQVVRRSSRTNRSYRKPHDRKHTPCISTSENCRIKFLPLPSSGCFQYLGPCAKHDDTPQTVKVSRTARRKHVHKLGLSEADQYCWLLASKALAKHGVPVFLYFQRNPPDPDDPAAYFTDCTKCMLVDRIGDIPRIVTLSGVVTVATLVIVGFPYGGVHLAAWHTIYKTKVEEYLWKTSAILLATSGPIGVGIIFVFCSWKTEGKSVLYSSRYNIHTGRGNTSVCYLLYVSFLVVVGAVYVVARVYLIVESFINLMYLEESVFVVLNWLQYVPHIT
jgi:hypothetical protein